jgi:hypothetical protein
MFGMDHVQEIANLRKALSSWSNSGGERSVRDAVTSVTTTLKAAGWPVEAIIVQAKTTAREAGLPPYLTDTAQTGDQRVANVVRWTIQSYYGDG